MNFEAVLVLSKTAGSAQTHKSISFIWIVWSTLYVYLCACLENLGGSYPIFFQVHALENMRWHPQNHFSGCRLKRRLCELIAVVSSICFFFNIYITWSTNSIFGRVRLWISLFFNLHIEVQMVQTSFFQLWHWNTNSYLVGSGFGFIHSSSAVESF